MSNKSITEQFEAFYKEYWGFINYEVQKYYSVSNNSGDYEDCIQSVSEKMWEKAPLIVELKRMQKVTYIRTTIRNYYISQIRRTAQYKLCDLDDTLAAEDDVTLQFLEYEQSQILHSCLAQMKECSRSAIEMYYFSDLDCKEIAKRLKIRPNSVRTYLSRARKELNEILEKNGFERY